VTIEGVIIAYLILLGIAFLAIVLTVGWWMGNGR